MSPPNRSPCPPDLDFQMLSSTSPPTSPTLPSSQTAQPHPSTLKQCIILRTSSPALAETISQLRLTIAPIVHVETGLPAPDFPTTILHLFLLTESQLDALASYYSQVTPSELTWAYPSTMDWTRWILEKPQPGEPPECSLTDLERLRIKMRMFAGFIGMKGTETPAWEIERGMELLERRIGWEIEMEERAAAAGRKTYTGPGTWS